MKSYREIVRLVWPLALGMINNAVMQFVDRAYLARESMESLEAVGLIERYTVQGQPYLQLPTWAKHQRIRNQRSRFPAPPSG